MISHAIPPHVFDCILALNNQRPDLFLEADNWLDVEPTESAILSSRYRQQCLQSRYGAKFSEKLVLRHGGKSGGRKELRSNKLTTIREIRTNLRNGGQIALAGRLPMRISELIEHRPTLNIQYRSHRTRTALRLARILWGLIGVQSRSSENRKWVAELSPESSTGSWKWLQLRVLDCYPSFWESIAYDVTDAIPQLLPMSPKPRRYFLYYVESEQSIPQSVLQSRRYQFERLAFPLSKVRLLTNDFDQDIAKLRWFALGNNNPQVRTSLELAAYVRTIHRARKLLSFIAQLENAEPYATTIRAAATQKSIGENGVTVDPDISTVVLWLQEEESRLWRVIADSYFALAKAPALFVVDRKPLFNAVEFANDYATKSLRMEHADPENYRVNQNRFWTETNAAITNIEEACKEAVLQAAKQQHTPPETGTILSPLSNVLDEKTENDSFVFVRRGKIWEITFEKNRVDLIHMGGFDIIAQLLSCPNKEISCLELAGSDPSLALATKSDQPALDSQAIEAYRRRVASLEEQREEAKEFGHFDEIAKIEAEIDQIKQQAVRDVQGDITKVNPNKADSRDLNATTPAESARQKVNKSLGRAIERLVKEIPDCGNHLNSCISKGLNCSYRPPEPAPNWNL